MVRGPAMAPVAGPGAVAAAAAAAAAAAEEMRWRQLDSGVSAVSFGFVATAILVSMFLAMAILEHFLRPPAHAAAPPPRGILRRLLGRGGGRGAAPGADLEAARKLEGHAPLEETVDDHHSAYTGLEHHLFMACKPNIVVRTIVGPFDNLSLSQPHWKVPLMIPVYPKGVSVLMPGQDVPTFIAHPAPAPCPPERIQWPSHQAPPFAGSSSNPS
ncbi:uncharacterized protein C2845_PM04G26710 [Panicum miliaceum]|uniref:Uncharacterized protein n=1 Tax=Panicum miliaceum TaxID=4540 RepID=A0A3L6QPG7_PANMI|nr:uncharacterized protein C2845_PM04G26710 [Panicum miliaceum]